MAPGAIPLLYFYNYRIPAAGSRSKFLLTGIFSAVRIPCGARSLIGGTFCRPTPPSMQPRPSSRAAGGADSPSQPKKCGAVGAHGWHEQAAVEKEVAHFTARLCNQQAAVAGGAMSRPIAAAVVGLVIGADRIVGKDPRSFQCSFENPRESRRGSDES